MTCQRCKGQGFTFFDSVVVAFANFLQSWLGRPFDAVCKRCHGTGIKPPSEGAPHVGRQYSQAASAEYGRHLRGEISLHDYATSDTRNDEEAPPSRR